MNQDVELFLQQTIFPDMERGRPDWDVPHTKSVVSYMKEILAANPDLGLDEPVLIIAAYAHDWGYAGLFEVGRSISLAEVKDRKPAHMVIGSQKIGRLLQDIHFSFLTQAQKRRIVHLVGKHDKLSELVDTDELVLMEADTLGMCDSDATTPTYSVEDDKKFRAATESKRVTRFVTNYSKSKIKSLLQKRAQYYADLAAHG